jgi:hypothetical protein
MLHLTRSHKLIVFLSLLVLLFPASFVYEKYLDWDNAQMIKGLASDFPELVEQIETETGLDLEEKSDCMTTSEKFSAGVKNCEFEFYGIDETETQTKQAYSIVEKNSKFEKNVIFENKEGYTYNYRNKESCSFANTKGIYGSCVVGVRDANVVLSKKLFTK